MFKKTEHLPLWLHLTRRPTFSNISVFQKAAIGAAAAQRRFVVKREGFEPDLKASTEKLEALGLIKAVQTVGGLRLASKTANNPPFMAVYKIVFCF